MKPVKIAITGGIGAGKSHICGMLAKRGIRIYDCDTAAKRLIRSSATLKERLCKLAGEGLYSGGAFQKAVLAKYILESDEHAREVNEVIHPAVAEDFMQSGYDWLESAILFDSGFDKRIPLNAVVCVTAPLETRIARVMARDGISREKTLEWINRQLPQEEVRRRSDYEITNDGKEDIDKQIDFILKSINQEKIMLQTILSIAGKPGLYKLVKRGKTSLIVETLDDKHKRMPAFATDRVTSLADIAMFTDSEDVPLGKVLANVCKKEDGKEASLNWRKASPDELNEYFAEVLPDYDRDRVRPSDIKKLLQWYDILVNNGITDFENELKPTDGDNIDDRKEQE